MKRVYWLLIAAVPVMLWWLSQGGSQQESQKAPARPEPEKPKPEPEKSPDALKDLPTSSNGAFPKAAPVETAPVVEPPDSDPPVQEPSVVEVPPEVTEAAPEESVAPAAPPEKIAEVAEIAPPAAPQIEVAVSEPVVESDSIQLFDSKDRSQDARLLEITGLQAYVRCTTALPDKEKVRLVLPFGESALTLNGQLLSVEEGVSRFKILTMKAGQKKRFEEYLAQRSSM